MVLIGLSGVRWSDVTPEDTPALTQFTSEASVAQLSVRTVQRVTCPIDAWLTIGSSRRSTIRFPAPPTEQDTEDRPLLCPPIPAVVDDEVQGWDSLVEYNASLSFNAPLGLLGSTAESTGRSVAGVGPGGGLAAADRGGAVQRYILDPRTVTSKALSSVDLSLIDLGAVDERDPAAPGRTQQVRSLDAALGRLLLKVPANATVLVVAGANSQPTAELQLIAIRGPDYPNGLLYSTSTRHDGLVLLTDITPTIFELTGMPPAKEFVGAPVVSVPSDKEPGELRAELVDQATKVELYSQAAGPFFTVMLTLQLALYAAAAWAFRRKAHLPGPRRRILSFTGWVALICSAIPVATFIANLVPWWTKSMPDVWLVALILFGAGALAAGARAIGKRGDPLAEIGLVAGVTVGVLTLDVLLGGPLQTASLMGYSPVVAGRFYGFGNVAFSVFATALIFVAAWVSNVMYLHGRQKAAPWVVLGAGAVGLLLDGLPQAGSDFGGMLAIVAGFGVFFLGARQVRVTPARIVAVLVLGVALAMAVSVIDWLRPSDERSHLGGFVQQILDGEFFDVVGRKFSNNLDILVSAKLGLLVPIALLFMAFVLLRPLHKAPPLLTVAFTEAPMLRPAVMGWVTLMLVGFALNDSGIAIPAVGIMLAVPFLIVVSVSVADRHPDSVAAMNQAGS